MTRKSRVPNHAQKLTPCRARFATAAAVGLAPQARTAVPITRAQLSASVRQKMKTLALVITVCAMTACMPTCKNKPPSRFVFADEPTAARHQLEQLVPLGTPDAEAAEILGKKGFLVSTEHGAFGAESFADYLYCDYRDGGVPVSRRWQAALVLKEGRVVDYRVTTGLIGP